jgi:DNA-binding transcriptional ArsR family regulator
MSAEPATIFAALGDPLRLELVARIGAEGQSISDLARDLPITRQGATKHLRVLEASGLIRSERRGREVIWHGATEGILVARKALDEIGAGWAKSLHRLKDLVEGRNS